MTPQAQPNPDEVQIRQLIEDRLNSVRVRDIDSAAANVTADVLSFDVVNPLQYAGRDSLRARVAEWFSSFDGPIGLEVKDLTLAANGDVGFSHCLNRVCHDEAWHETGNVVALNGLLSQN